MKVDGPYLPYVKSTFPFDNLSTRSRSKIAVAAGNLDTDKEDKFLRTFRTTRIRYGNGRPFAKFFISKPDKMMLKGRPAGIRPTFDKFLIYPLAQTFDISRVNKKFAGKYSSVNRGQAEIRLMTHLQ
jgi:hypothetical protein